MVPRANGGARSAAFSLARLLPSLVCVASPSSLRAHAGGNVPLARNQARHLSGTGCLDVARAAANGLGFTVIRLLGDAENARDFADENKAVG
jgi:hypothetical protein